MIVRPDQSTQKQTKILESKDAQTENEKFKFIIMSTVFLIGKVQPDAYKPLLELDKYVARITINAWNRIGVSLNMHPDL